MSVKFHNDGSAYRLRRKREVARWVMQCVEREGFEAGDINFIFCSPERHIEINRQYLGHDYYTDVITFDYSDHDEGVVAGDIFIDPRTVRDNALFYGSSARAEMLRVLIHGVLHLCGYKDKTAADQSSMREAEDRCLSYLA